LGHLPRKGEVLYRAIVKSPIPQLFTFHYSLFTLHLIPTCHVLFIHSSQRIIPLASRRQFHTFIAAKSPPLPKGGVGGIPCPFPATPCQRRRLQAFTERPYGCKGKPRAVGANCVRLSYRVIPVIKYGRFLNRPAAIIHYIFLLHLMPFRPEKTRSRTYLSGPNPAYTRFVTWHFTDKSDIIILEAGGDGAHDRSG